MKKLSAIALVAVCLPLMFGAAGLCPLLNVDDLATTVTLLDKVLQLPAGASEVVATFTPTLANKAITVTVTGPAGTNPDVVVTDDGGTPVLTAISSTDGSETGTFTGGAVQTYSLTLDDATGTGGSFTVVVTQAP